MKIAIIGLGLIGGSLAKSIKRRTAHIVLGFDSNRETMISAGLLGVIDDHLTEENLAGCDLVLLAILPGDAIRWTQEHVAAISPAAILVDMCGVKRVVCTPVSSLAKKYGFTYIGGHPMAGKERGGFTNSADDFFVGAAMILTPDRETDIYKLEKLKNFFLDIGFASLTFSNPAEHDRIIAFTSQLAHLVSSAYVKSPQAQLRRGFSAGSYEDMTRVALLDEWMWTELFLANVDNLAKELDLLIGHLQEYQTALKEQDSERLRQLLRDGREKKAMAGGF